MFFFFSSRRRHTRFDCDWSSDVCSSDLSWRRSEPASQQQDDEDQQDESEATARIVTPPPTVRPRRQRAEEQHDEQDDENQRHRRSPFDRLRPFVACCIKRTDGRLSSAHRKDLLSGVVSVASSRNQTKSRHSSGRFLLPGCAPVERVKILDKAEFGDAGTIFTPEVDFRT